MIRTRRGYSFFLCRKCGSEMKYKSRRRVVYGNVMIRPDPWCPVCMKFTRKPILKRILEEDS